MVGNDWYPYRRQWLVAIPRPFLARITHATRILQAPQEALTAGIPIILVWLGIPLLALFLNHLAPSGFLRGDPEQ